MKLIPLTKGYHAMVDDEDHEWLSQHKWHVQDGRLVYAGRKLGGYALLMHRKIMGLERGDKRQVDHINGNGLDNRKENLRICTHIENCRNSRKSKRGASMFKGVSLRAPNKWKAWKGYDGPVWYARVYAEGITYSAGYHKSEEAAARAYDAKARELFGEFARTNF